MQREGKYPNQKSPLQLGLECSGFIEEIGKGISEDLKVGDRVMALLNGGGYSQVVDVNAGFCMKLPEKITVIHWFHNE